MRLTLRFMLAYMDEILDPEDAQELGKKIEESEHASKLMHRIRDCMRRLRLGAPDVADRGALDCNTVAEYLDHMLPPDRVPDFERVCLESDVHLAEVASCHQILALVLGEPAEVDAATRQKMYQLPEHVAQQTKSVIEQAEVTGDALLAQEGLAAGDEKPKRQRPEVPEYLRAETGGRRLWPVFLAGAAALLVLAAGIGAVAWKLRTDTQPAPADSTSMAWNDARESAEGTEKGSKEPAESPPTGGSQQASPPATPAKDPVAEGKAANPPSSGQTPAASVPPEEEAKPAEGAAAAPPGATPAPASPLGEAPAAAPAKEPSAPGPGAMPEGTTVASLPANPPAGTAPAAATPGEEKPATPEAAPPLPSVARLVSAGGVLLRYQPAGALWLRLPDQAELYPGDKCQSLPSYQSLLSWPGKGRARLVDATLVELVPNDPQGHPMLAIDSGRVVLQPEAAAAQMRLAVGGRVGIVQFADDASALAVEAGRVVVSNEDPETQPSPMSVTLYATSGKVTWQEGDRPPVTLEAPSRLLLADPPQSPAPVDKFPGWIAGDSVNLLEQQAGEAVARELKPDRPVGLTLRELTEHRKREVRWLSLRCLAALGDFDLLTSALEDPEQRNQSYFEIAELLQASVRRGPRTAGQVRTAMENQHGDEGAGLYEMLWRFAGRDATRPLDAMEAAELVAYLEHSSLAFRRLAFWNLTLTQGNKSYNYKPEDPAVKREPAVRKWKEHFAMKPAARPGSSPLDAGGQSVPPMSNPANAGPPGN